MRKTQKQRILESDAPVHKIGKRSYKGQRKIYCKETGRLLQQGIPFIRLD